MQKAISYHDRNTSFEDHRRDLKKQQLVTQTNIAQAGTLKLANLTKQQHKAIARRASEMVNWKRNENTHQR